MQLHLRAFLKAAVAGGAAGVGIGLTLWAHAALASPGTPPTPVQLCAKAGGAVVYAASGTCPGNTTAIAPVAQQSGVADLYTRLNADDVAISSLQSQATTAINNIASLQSQVVSLQSQVTTANTAIGSLQGHAITDTNSIANLQSGETSLQSQIAGLQSEVNSLQSQVTSLATTDTNNFSSLQTQVTTDTNNIAGLHTQETTDTNNIASLQSLLNGVSRGPVNGYHTLTFSGMNVQMVNGTGSESTLNGLGNLIVGYADDPYAFARTGSHNLISGDNGGWTSYGGLLAAQANQISAPFASISGGAVNIASGIGSSVSGGEGNTASGRGASVSGGSSFLGDDTPGNMASGPDSSVSGGQGNTASGYGAWIGGGYRNTASGGVASVSGGDTNTADGPYASISGGLLNVASGSRDAILGGNGNTIANTYYCAYFPDSPTTSHC
jgi:hypothetical protein